MLLFKRLLKVYKDNTYSKSIGINGFINMIHLIYWYLSGIIFIKIF